MVGGWGIEGGKAHYGWEQRFMTLKQMFLCVTILPKEINVLTTQHTLKVRSETFAIFFQQDVSRVSNLIHHLLRQPRHRAPACGRCLLPLPRVQPLPRRQGSSRHEERMRLRPYRTHFLRQWKPELPAEQTDRQTTVSEDKGGTVIDPRICAPDCFNYRGDRRVCGSEREGTVTHLHSSQN